MTRQVPSFGMQGLARREGEGLEGLLPMVPPLEPRDCLSSLVPRLEHFYCLVPDPAMDRPMLRNRKSASTGCW